LIFYISRTSLFFLVFFSLFLELIHFPQDGELYEISKRSLLLIELITILFLVLALFTARKGYLSLCLLYVPIPLVLWEWIKRQDMKRDERIRIKQEEPDMQRLTEIIEKAVEPALIYKALVELGDLYVKRQEYEKAIGFYMHAEEICERNKFSGLLGLSFKIKRAEKENRVKKGEIWVCMECSFDNPSSITVCKNCGHAKVLRKSIKSDLLKQKQEIKKDVLNIIFPVAAITAGLHLIYFLLHLFAFLYSHMARWLSCSLILVFFALTIFFFIKLIVFVKNTVVPKLLK